MEKYLVTIEFRYEDGSCQENKKITIGVYDTFDEAEENGNKTLEVFERHFPLNEAWNKKDRFSKNGGCFGEPKTLVTNLTYLQTPFSFYANITKLKYEDVEQTILDVIAATERYQEYKKRKELKYEND